MELFHEAVYHWLSLFYTLIHDYQLGLISVFINYPLLGMHIPSNGNMVEAEVNTVAEQGGGNK